MGFLFPWENYETVFPTSKSFLQAVRDCIQEWCGDVGYGKILYSLAVKYWSSLGSFAIVRVSRSQLKPVLGCLAILSGQLDRKMDFTVVHVGGTLRTCKKFLLKKYSNENIRKEIGQLDTLAT
ncbi:hypothetical protein GpartN1_g7555.t1 [Galdieria partita]|uniref:Ribonuclease P/MRP protein subunit POP5 n=1 Tax=Galdieria partita TaxID=83374 RepID=A0A9C7Q3R7_9RHOD|nr:hypothetical protein GpartN1_g7555.t1 [Galdieria partita]